MTEKPRKRRRLWLIALAAIVGAVLGWQAAAWYDARRDRDAPPDGTPDARTPAETEEHHDTSSETPQ